MPKRTIKTIENEYNKYKDLEEGFSDLLKIAPPMDVNMRKIMNHLYNRVECMGKILELSEKKSEDDAVKEKIAKNKKYLENSDKFLANLETDTRKKWSVILKMKNTQICLKTAHGVLPTTLLCLQTI